MDRTELAEAENERRRAAHAIREEQHKVLHAEMLKLDTVQRTGSLTGGLTATQHRRMAELLTALSEDEDDPVWVIARAQQAQAHAALASIRA